MNTYYKDQFAKITPNNGKGFTTNVKIYKSDVSTNAIALNDESATELVKWLKENFTIDEEFTFGGNWSTEDIKQSALDREEPIELTEDQAREIAETIDRCHDATVGINWDVINEHISMWLQDNT